MLGIVGHVREMNRWLAMVAWASIALGTALTLLSAFGEPDYGFDHYISESGVAGAPGENLYRAGVLTIAVGVGLLGRVLAPALAGALLLASSPILAVSGIVACTTGCPLPPHASPTVQDLVHGGASILALGLAFLAIAAAAINHQDGTVRRVSRLAVVPAFVLLAAAALAILVQARGLANGVLERSAVASELVWLLAVSGVLAWPRITARPRPINRTPATSATWRSKRPSGSTSDSPEIFTAP